MGGQKISPTVAGLILAGALFFLGMMVYVFFRPQPLEYPSGTGAGGPGAGAGAMGGPVPAGPNSVTGVKPMRPGLMNNRR